MSDGADWEHAPRRRGGVLLAVVAALGVAAVAGLLLRPAPAEPEPAPGLEVGPDDGPAVVVREPVIRISSLDPTTLVDRGRTVELAASRDAVGSAVSDDGRLLVVATPDRERSVLAAFDARTLEAVGDVRRIDGQLERLSVGPDRAAVAWQEARSGRGPAPVVVAPLLGGEPRPLDLPPRFEVLDLRALGGTRVAVVGGQPPPGAGAQGSCVVLLADEQDVVEVPLPDRLSCAGDGLEPGMQRPAVAWDLGRDRVHLVPADGSLLSVDLETGDLSEVAVDAAAPGPGVIAVRHAAVSPDGAVLYSTGFLLDASPNPTPLAPVAHRLDGGGVLAVGAPDALGGGHVAAVGRRTFVSVVAEAVPSPRSDIPLHLSVHPIGSWEPHARHLLAGAASTVQLSDDEQRVTVVSHDSGAPVLRVLDVSTGEVLAERAGFAPRAQVHLREGIVVELLD